MTDSYLLMIIFGMFAVTYPVRFLPLIYFNRIGVHPILKIWLGYVPIAIFASLLTQTFYKPAMGLADIHDLLPLVASCLGALLITMKMRSVGWGMGLGLVLYVLMRLFLPL